MVKLLLYTLYNIFYGDKNSFYNLIIIFYTLKRINNVVK